METLSTGEVTFASLDHDIGSCYHCAELLLHIGDMRTPETTFYNYCSHVKSGYDVVYWMEQNNVWPVDGCVVHSMNPVGKQRMEAIIRNHYGGR